ncbi:MAG: hypothetical protein ACI9U2_004871 [Bradymonadia bacterium]|jgi:hypothetical protein
MDLTTDAHEAIACVRAGREDKGTAFFISERIALTAAHVVQGLDACVLRRPDGSVVGKATVEDRGEWDGPGERPGGGRRMLMMTEPLKLPDWTEADGILADEGVPSTLRLELRQLYEAWLTTESFAKNAQLLERELGADDDEEEDN